MTPYRIAPQREDRRRRNDVGDAFVLAALLLIIGGLRIVIAIMDHEVFGTEATIALLMVVMGAVIRVRGR